MPWDKNPSPWGSPGNSGNGGNKPPSGNDQQPDLGEIFRRGREKFGGSFGSGQKNQKSVFLVAIVVLLCVWLASGVFKVEPNEQGVVLRFGKYNRVALQGLNYRLPYPIENHINVPTEDINSIKVGVSSTSRKSSSHADESMMLTGDENIVYIDFDVQWKIADAEKFLFNVRDQEKTIKSAAESAMREVVGRSELTKTITNERSKIQDQTKVILQAILDSYEAGIEIRTLKMDKGELPTPVIPSFRDVQAAKADKERIINEAEAYRNDITPKARGEAQRITQQAEAFKQQIVSKAKGEAGRFTSVYEKYKRAKVVTRKRMYLETMEEILNGTEKIIIDSGAKGSGVIPYLPLPELNKRK